MSRLIATYMIVGTFVVASSGCHPVSYGSQDFTIVLERVESSDPVQGALVKFASQAGYRTWCQYDITQTDYLARHTNTGRTDEFGRAVFTTRTATYGSTKLYDEVTYEDYLFEIQNEETEIVTVWMVPGELSRGCHFKILVDSIGEPIADD